MRAALLTALAAVLLAVVPGTAFAAIPQAPLTESATAGNVTATFTHQSAGDGTWNDMQITVTRAGVTGYSGMPKVPGCAAPYCAPDGAAAGRPSLKVVDVTGDAEPEVIVNVYSGGAHCCEIAVVLRWTGKAYKVITRNFADPGYTLVPVASFPSEWVTADARFGYEFTDYADSAMPVQIFTLDGGAWSDQTLSHVATIKADAARWKKAYRKVRDGTSSLGVLAAYVADEYQLDHATSADAYLQHEMKAGKLKSPSKPWPAGKAYIKLLKKDLKAWGYAPRRGAAL